MGSIFILRESLPLDFVKLGRLVANVANPEDSSHDPLPAEDLRRIVTDYKDFEGIDGKDRGNSLFLKLTSLVSLSRSKQHGFVRQVGTKRGKRYRFDNSTEYFRRIIKLTDTRKWIETTLKEGGKIYLLVGYVTFLDAVVTEFETRFQSTDLSLTAPLSLSVSLGLGAPVPALIPADVLDPSTGASRNRADGIRLQVTVEGEQVFALEYRQVNISLRKIKAGEDGKLGKCEWKVITRHRQPQKLETEDVVEADVNESEERDNFEFDEDDDDEEWTKVVDEDGDFYL